MKIDPRTSVQPQFGGAPRRPDEGTTTRPASASRTTPARVDSIQLSSESREARGVISAERVGEIQSRIRAGFYDSAPVADAVARRLLASGDI